ncbi:MAG: AAA family ATPase [Anaerolineales bacterium]|uniref:R3H domain-containing nucleic acid-binding protein n=1 Tax=Promineifilum sp. TaxID=2664178 RepID=UPI001DFD3B2D|nr:AAA family ATPase [Anaerolineales bacterium]MCB8935102.1 AAA family ATPase [Promineifilum sp.]MCO5179167.1 AAA family ATPase [Promineifilum sp.]
MNSIQSHEDLRTLLSVLPESIRERVDQIGREDELLEIVMDLGRLPTARYVDGEVILRDTEVTHEEIEQVVAGIGDFDDDNRAGIARTLHRISGIRNRHAQVVGLTCRVGRAVYGTIDIVEDIVTQGHSILILGRPGVGKTTMLREMARILAETKRVIIVDTSNEIGGDGDIPHPAVGRARRMQVPHPAHQHETMIEAVENHNPEVIVIDEIGRERETEAARTINERGVQLIGTAHGNTLENILLNPTLSDLVGGIESVTLSDEEARRRGTQKTVLERRAPPTFDVLIEMQDRQRLLVHNDVTTSVDAMLRGEPVQVELRYSDDDGKIHSERQSLVVTSAAVTGRRGGTPGVRQGRGGREIRAIGESTGRAEESNRQATLLPPTRPATSLAIGNEGERPFPQPAAGYDNGGNGSTRKLRVYAYGVARNRLYQAAKHLGVKLLIAETLEDADVLVTLKSYYRKRRRLINDAEQRNISVYVLRANTVSQMERFLVEALGLEVAPATDPFESSIAETERAIMLVQSGQPSMDLRPAGSAIRRYQHEMVRQANLISHSYGREPLRHVRIFNTPRND